MKNNQALRQGISFKIKAASVAFVALSVVLGVDVQQATAQNRNYGGKKNAPKTMKALPAPARIKSVDSQHLLHPNFGQSPWVGAIHRKADTDDEGHFVYNPQGTPLRDANGDIKKVWGYHKDWLMNVFDSSGKPYKIANAVGESFSQNTGGMRAGTGRNPDGTIAGLGTWYQRNPPTNTPDGGLIGEGFLDRTYNFWRSTPPSTYRGTVKQSWWAAYPYIAGDGSTGYKTKDLNSHTLTETPYDITRK